MGAGAGEDQEPGGDQKLDFCLGYWARKGFVFFEVRCGAVFAWPEERGKVYYLVTAIRRGPDGRVRQPGRWRWNLATLWWALEG